MNKKYILSILLFILYYSALAQSIPMKKGTYWLFKTEIRYQNINDTTLRKKTLITKMLITNYLSKKDGYKISAITGCPSNYAWYEDGKIINTKTVLIETPKQEYYLISLEERDVKNLSNINITELLKYEQPFFKENIKEGDILCKNKDVDCNEMNHFVCESVLSKNLKGTNNLMKQYNMVFRSGPDDLSWQLAKGSGFLNYEYNHHGSPMEVSAHLLKFHKE